MRRPTILRIGVCGCPGAGFYRGALNGRRISVRQLADGSLLQPRQFVLQEVSVPEKNHWDTIRIRRCHFFLDLHRQGRGHITELDGVQLAFNGERPLPKADFGRYRSLVGGGWFAREWKTGRRLSARQIIATIQGLIERQDRLQLRYWLDQGRLPKAAFQLG